MALSRTARRFPNGSQAHRNSTIGSTASAIPYLPASSMAASAWRRSESWSARRRSARGTVPIEGEQVVDGLEPDPEIGVLHAPAHRRDRPLIPDAAQQEEHVAHDVPARVGEQGRGVARHHRPELREQVEEAEAHAPVLGPGEHVEQVAHGGRSHALDQRGNGAEHLLREVGQGRDEGLDRVAVGHLPGGGAEGRRQLAPPRYTCAGPDRRARSPLRSVPRPAAGGSRPRTCRRMGGRASGETSARSASSISRAVGSRSRPGFRRARPTFAAAGERTRSGAVLRQVEKGRQQRGGRLGLAEGVDVLRREGPPQLGELPRLDPGPGRAGGIGLSATSGTWRGEHAAEHLRGLRGEDRGELLHQPGALPGAEAPGGLRDRRDRRRVLRLRRLPEILGDGLQRRREGRRSPFASGAALAAALEQHPEQIGGALAGGDPRRQSIGRDASVREKPADHPAREGSRLRRRGLVVSLDEGRGRRSRGR